MLRSAIALSLLTTGCALYVRPMNTLTPDDHVVLELNDQGIPDMAPKLGSGTFLVGGKLQKMDSTSLVMSVYRTQSTHALLGGPYSYTDTYRYPGYVQWGGETVAVPKFDVASARVERVSGPFVALVSVGVVAVGVSMAEILLHHPNLKTPTLPTFQNPPHPFPYPSPIVLRAWPRL
jgi:hypothetical protein